MGNIPELAFNYIQLFGHVAEDDWPYTSGNGVTGDCEYDYNGMPPVVGLTGYNTLTPNDQDAVMTHLAEVGPLAVGVASSLWKGSEWSTLIGRDCKDRPLIGRDLYRTEIFSWCCYASSLMP